MLLLQALLTGIWLGNEHRVNVYAKGLGVVWIQGMLSINESGRSAIFLYFCNSV